MAGRNTTAKTPARNSRNAKTSVKKPSTKKSPVTKKKLSAAAPIDEYTRRRRLFAEMTAEKRTELVFSICDTIASSERGIANILKDSPDFPSYTMFFDWLAADEELANRYARAKTSQAEYMADMLMDISDDGRNDWMEGRDGSMVINGEHVQRSKLRVDTRKWLMAKLAPKKFGDVTTLRGDPEAPLNPAPKADLSKLDDKELQTLLALQRKLEGGN